MVGLYRIGVTCPEEWFLVVLQRETLISVYFIFTTYTAGEKTSNDITPHVARGAYLSYSGQPQ